MIVCNRNLLMTLVLESNNLVDDILLSNPIQQHFL